MKNSHLNPSSKSIKVRSVTLGKMPNGFGHGVEFHVKQKNGSMEIVAFLEGFEWYHGRSQVMVVKTRPKSEIDPEVMRVIREAVERAGTAGDVPNGQLSDNVFAWING